MPHRAFLGTAFHTPHCGKLEVLEDVLIEVGESGAIAAIHRQGEPAHAAALAVSETAGRLQRLAPGQYLMPGLVDLHIHAPQWPQMGKALDVPLEVWLHKHTFPLESKYADVSFAREIYTDLVANLLANGTTTAVYFATIHLAASLALAEICLRKGQRAFVGKVAMDDPQQCPDYYRDADAAAAIEQMRLFIRRLTELAPGSDPLVRPIITPRFIPSCTDALLRGLGELARDTGCLVQTHCSESDWERDHVERRFRRTDAEVLAGFGLLRRSTILAHSNFVTGGDLDLIRRHQSAVAHCPLSNVYFANAVFPLRQALDRQVHVGLGSDISGGYSPSILDSCRHALLAARARQGGVKAELDSSERGVAGAAVSAAEAFWLATAGGGEALGLQIGKFETGYRFDALVVDAAAAASNVRLWPAFDGPEAIFEKLVLNAARANIVETWVDGKRVSANR